MSDSVIQSQLEPVVYSSGGEVVIPWLLLFIWNGEVEPEILKTTLFVPDGLIITFLFMVLFFSVVFFFFFKRWEKRCIGCVVAKPQRWAAVQERFTCCTIASFWLFFFYLEMVGWSVAWNCQIRHIYIQCKHSSLKALSCTL